MVLKSDKVCKNLKKKGFVECNTHHKYYEFVHEGKVILHTKVSHNGQDINDYLISQMKSQCMLSKQEFLDLVNCPLSLEEYVKILKNKGAL
jgi:predicted RNA binding protein YcfA (HicA-like mRNA interferase family)